MGIDPETGKYNHYYLEKIFELNDDDEENEEENHHRIRKYKVCSICNDIENKHVSSYSVEPKFERTSVFESQMPFVSSDGGDGVYKSNNIIKKLNQKIVIDNSFIEELEKGFKDKNLCIICYANELTDISGVSYRLPCGHTFCRDCVKSYIENRINEAKIDMKCLQAGCIHLIPEDVIKNIAAREIFQRYISTKKRIEVMEYINNGYIPCTAPDCEELVAYKEGGDPFIECRQGHEFCAKCKEKWHQAKNCRNVFYI
jgi:hypothetical protein